VAFTADGDRGTLLLAMLDVLHDAVKLKLRNLRTLEGVGIEGVAELVLGRTLLEAGNEVVIDTFLNQQAGSGAAALAVVEEDTEVGPGDGVVDIGIVKDNVG